MCKAATSIVNAIANHRQRRFSYCCCYYWCLPKHNIAVNSLINGLFDIGTQEDDRAEEVGKGRERNREGRERGGSKE